MPDNPFQSPRSRPVRRKRRKLFGLSWVDIAVIVGLFVLLALPPLLRALAQARP